MNRRQRVMQAALGFFTTLVESDESRRHARRSLGSVNVASRRMRLLALCLSVMMAAVPLSAPVAWAQINAAPGAPGAQATGTTPAGGGGQAGVRLPGEETVVGVLHLPHPPRGND